MLKLISYSYNHSLTMNDVILGMNYLAHAYLSFNNGDILAGNMITDFVKGKSQYDYPFAIQKGIRLHRLIDEFTDAHVVTAEAKTFFKHAYRLYSGAFIDVVYDHFLALDKKQFKVDVDLNNFSQQAYKLLDENFSIFPGRFQKMFPYMKSQNWLYNYQFKEGIQKSFQGIVYRSAYLKESEIAFEIFNEHYTELENCYNNFFPTLKQFALENLRNLLAQ
jgi:acyl carrier protein phosphodiesterase